MKHRYSEVIKHWADGGTIQYLDEVDNGEYIYYDWASSISNLSPNFDWGEWRIKPEVLKYKLAVFKLPKGKLYLDLVNIPTTRDVEFSEGFVKWVHDGYLEVDV